MNSRPCKCGHYEHYTFGLQPCCGNNCYCREYEPVSDDAVRKIKEKAELLKYIAEYNTVKSKIQCALSQDNSLREMTNAEFEDWFRANVDPKTNPDTIRRSKQKLVAENHLLYGPVNTETARHRRIKEEATKQWVQS